MREIELAFNLLDQMEETCYLVDPETSALVYANASFFKNYGYPPEGIGQLKITDFNLVVNTPEKWHEQAGKVLKSGMLVFETRHLAAEGAARTVEVSCKTVNFDGERYLFTVARDISNRKNREEAALLRAEFHKTILDNMIGGAFIFNEYGQFISINKRAAEILGYHPAELIGRSAVAIIHPEDYLSASQQAQNVLTEKEGTSATLRARHKNGNWIVLETYSISLLDNPSVSGVLTTFQDVTPHIEARELIAAQQKQLRKVLDAVPAAVWAKDWNGKYTIANASFTKTFGSTPEEVIGKTDLDLGISPERHSQVLERDREVLLRSEPTELLEEPFVHPETGETGWFAIRKVPLTSDFQHQTLSVAVDITDRMNYDKQLQDTNTELTRANQDLDRFIYSATHELRSPITSSMALLELMHRDNSPEGFRELFPMLNRALTRMDDIVKNLTIYLEANNTSAKADLIEFKVFIAELGNSLKGIPSGHDIRFDCNISQNVPFYSDRGRLNYIIGELIKNAFMYSDPSREASYVRFSVTAGPDKAEIRVEDNGIGIEEKYLHRVFDIYFRIAEQSQGTGLGLYVAKEHAIQLGGDIQANSVLGKGSVFTVTIPNMKP